VCAYGQQSTWKNNKKCAVVLTYDDALNIHLDQVIPALDSVRLRGTFYLSVASPGFSKRMKEWKQAAAKGHELGNHTMYHPCRGGMPGREWVSKEYDLTTYSLRKVLDEIRMTNVVLESCDGPKSRTFAYPCGDMRVSDTSYVDAIKTDFIAARGVTSKVEQLGSIDFFNVNAFGISGESGEQLIRIVQQAEQQGGLVVFLFHGVGGEHSINVELKAHRQLLRYLKQHENDIWIAPFVDVMQYAKAFVRR
jgi:sialate O-acetylesterase